MESQAQTILRHLQTVAAERIGRQGDAALGQRVDAVKRFQHTRFQTTYAHLLSDTRYRDAARFFLDDLYGPRDFSDRDAQFRRVVPALVRVFPGRIVATVCDLAELHALSESLDTQMARFVTVLPLDWPAYAIAWQRTGARDQRMRQIALLFSIGQALDQHTRNALLRRTLHLMRSPARMAGLAALQAFLEKGFDTFGAMGGAEDFLKEIERCETRLALRLFEVDVESLRGLSCGEIP